MLIDRIYLRNYRVFEDELDLHVPPGLVGVYGPNGAGKSTLLEAILWALWGRSRTSKEEVRSAGSHGDCVAEVTFEHEGHVYVVRRLVTGAACTVKAQAHCDGQAVAEGVRDTARYIHSVLGMDDAAFRASVFAEQKQMDAFSSQGPADRRKLVLSLLGVTPLDVARDQARTDARGRTAHHDQLRRMLPDLAELEVVAADADGRAAALEADAVDAEHAAEALSAVAVSRRRDLTLVDSARQQHEALVALGQSARQRLDRATEEVAELQAELEELDVTAQALSQLGTAAEALGPAQERARLLRSVADAVQGLSGLPDVPMPSVPDDQELQAAITQATAAVAAEAAAQQRCQSALIAAADARRALERSASLSHQEGCPLCGQALGPAFRQVRQQRSNDLAAAEVALAEAEKDAAERAGESQQAQALVKHLRSRSQAAAAQLAAWQQASALRRSALGRVEASLEDLAQSDPATAAALGTAPSGTTVAAELTTAMDELAKVKAAADEAARLRGRLERQQAARAAHALARQRLDEAQVQIAGLRDQVKALGYDIKLAAEAAEAARQADAAAQQADTRARQARLEAARARATAEGEGRRLADGRAQHAQLNDLEAEAVHLARTAELLNGFRNTVVASVGPRLAVQASDLFAELTDNEYDRLEVDADTYGLKICDNGASYDLQRFSGSEVDLANLAMRVAISEHVRLLSGGTVGLLVLDEVFGPLDEERRARMLLALERLRARFRQVVVVTHSTEIKEQMPSAIEVVKRPGRRATARLLQN